MFVSDSKTLSPAESVEFWIENAIEQTQSAIRSGGLSEAWAAPILNSLGDARRAMARLKGGHMSADAVPVPVSESVHGSQVIVYCDGCEAFLGYRGYGETLGHAVLQCLKELRRLQREGA